MLISLFSCNKNEVETERKIPMQQKWNILWIVADDMSQDLSCYGDTIISTPNIDKLAKEGLLFKNTFTNAPYDGTSESVLFTGMYPQTLGAQYQNTEEKGYFAVPPPEAKVFTEYLRAAGYYCSIKGDINFQFGEIPTAWDDHMKNAKDENFRPLWKKRKNNQPFFSVIKLNDTHESRNLPNEDLINYLISKDSTLSKPQLNSELKHQDSTRFSQSNIKTEKIKAPPYLPNTKEVRNDFAKMYSNISKIDMQVGQILKQLEQDTLHNKTIVMFFSDNGRGMFRSKNWLYDSGTKVPLIVKWPLQFHPENKVEDLVSFVDFAPTILTFAGVKPPKHFQGKVFIGKLKGNPKEYVFLSRDGSSAVNEKIRGVRDKQYKYIKNYKTSLPYSAPMELRDKLASMDDVLTIKGIANKTLQLEYFFSQKKPKEELYDLLNDPFEMNNLAERTYFSEDLARLQEALKNWETNVGEYNNISEEEMIGKMYPNGVQPNTEIPELSIKGGQFTEPVKINLTCKTEGSSIAYAILLDGEGESNMKWQLYTDPFEVNKNCTVLAKAVRYGYKISETRSATFSFVEKLKDLEM